MSHYYRRNGACLWACILNGTIIKPWKFSLPVVSFYGIQNNKTEKKLRRGRKDDPIGMVPYSSLGIWIQPKIQCVQPLVPCCNLSQGTKGEVIQHGYFLFAFQQVAVLLREGQLQKIILSYKECPFVIEIAPLHAYFFASGYHHISCPHLSYFLNPGRK